MGKSNSKRNVFGKSISEVLNKCKLLCNKVEPEDFEDLERKTHKQREVIKDIRERNKQMGIGGEIRLNGGLDDRDRDADVSAGERLDDLEIDTENNKQLIWENRILLRVIDERTSLQMKILVGIAVTVLGGVIVLIAQNLL